MKFLFIDFKLPYILKDREFPAGGWSVQLKVLLTALSEAGHRAGVLTWKGANEYVGAQSTCDLLETYDKNLGIRKLRFFYYFVPSMIAAARAYKPDVILQSVSGVDTGIMAFIARRLNVPFVHRLACDADSDGQYSTYLNWSGKFAFRYGLHRTQLVICQNDYQRINMRQMFPHKPLLTLHNAIELSSKLSPPLARAHREYIAWVGIFRYVKNLALLYRIALQMPLIEFRVAGMLSQTTDPETEAAIADLAKLPNVRMVGYVKQGEIIEFLSRAVAILCTSRFEGFPNTFLEAFSVGTPVITGAGVDPSSIVARNNLGFVAKDEDHLATSVCEMWRMNSDGYDELAQRCRAYVKASHEPARIVGELVSHVRLFI